MCELLWIECIERCGEHAEAEIQQRLVDRAADFDANTYTGGAVLLGKDLGLKFYGQSTG